MAERRFAESLSAELQDPVGQRYAHARAQALMGQPSDALETLLAVAEGGHPRVLNLIVTVAAAAERTEHAAQRLAELALSTPSLGLWAGHLWRSADRPAEAIAVLSACLASDEGQLTHHVAEELMHAQVAASELAQAVTTGVGAMTRFPARAAAFGFSVASIQAALGRRDAAIATLDAVLLADPGHAAAAEQRARLCGELT